MTKVCHMTSVHAPEDVRIFKKECVSLAEAGYETYLVEQGDSYEKDGVHIIGVGAQENGRLARIFKMSRRVYKEALKIDADIYHFHDPELLPYGLKLKKKGKKVIFDSHENTAISIKEKYYIPRFLRNFIYHCYRKYEERICQYLDAVIYVSPNFVNDFSRLNKRIILLPNYPIVDKDNYREPLENSDSIIFAGLVIPTWSHENIIEAIKDIDSIKYTICGGVSDEYLSKLKKMPGWKKVDYKGRIPHEGVAKEMENSFIGVALMQPHLNSMGHQGTLGNTKVFEEMMAGLPVICTDFELWKPIIEENHCGICVDPNDIMQIHNAIVYLQNNREEARRMGKQGRRMVVEKYNWSVIKEDLLRLYEDIINAGE